MRGVAHRVNAERIVLFGWSRAILLQLSHPLIAAGVADHSSFRGGPFTAAARLHHTVRAMLALTFGEPVAREQTLEHIRGIHRRVRGHLAEAVGPFPAGTPYFADDPDLLLWVHATLLDSIPLVYEHLVMPLTMAERDSYCAEAADTAIALGARPAEVPRTWANLRTYVEAMHQSGRLVVGRQAREVTAAVLAPRMARLIAPAAAANRLVTVGLLPDPLRRQFGFAWNDRRERRLRMVLRVIRGTRRAMPPLLALWPEARRTTSDSERP
jgi:uncharacterized protein (DUF2236 family)